MMANRKIIYYRCLDCGEEFIVSSQKSRYCDGKKCKRCNSGLIFPDRETITRNGETKVVSVQW